MGLSEIKFMICRIDIWVITLLPTNCLSLGRGEGGMGDYSPPNKLLCHWGIARRARTCGHPVFSYFVTTPAFCGTAATGGEMVQNYRTLI